MTLHRPEISPATIRKWQRVVDLIAELASVPAALIMQTRAPCHSVFVSSNTPDNPYQTGLTFVLNDRLYCQNVIASDAELVVTDATRDPRWVNNDDMEHGMSFYIGLPIKWPDAQVFGTICVLDRRKNRRALLFRKGLEEFAKVVEDDLALITEIARREVAEAELRQILLDQEATIAARTQAVKDANVALRILLDNIQTSRAEAEAQTARQIRGLILPLVGKLRGMNAGNPVQSALLDVIAGNLADICSAQAPQKSDVMARLTASEVEVAELILMGRGTKEIARALGRGTSTVDFHRANIRRKLGLESRRTTLISHLKSLGQ